MSSESPLIPAVVRVVRVTRAERDADDEKHLLDVVSRGDVKAAEPLLRSVKRCDVYSECVLCAVHYERPLMLQLILAICKELQVPQHMRIDLARRDVIAQYLVDRGDITMIRIILDHGFVGIRYNLYYRACEAKCEDIMTLVQSYGIEITDKK